MAVNASMHLFLLPAQCTPIEGLWVKPVVLFMFTLRRLQESQNPFLDSTFAPHFIPKTLLKDEQ